MSNWLWKPGSNCVGGISFHYLDLKIWIMMLLVKFSIFLEGEGLCLTRYEEASHKFFSSYYGNFVSIAIFFNFRFKFHSSSNRKYLIELEDINFPIKYKYNLMLPKGQCRENFASSTLIACSD